SLSARAILALRLCGSPRALPPFPHDALPISQGIGGSGQTVGMLVHEIRELLDLIEKCLLRLRRAVGALDFCANVCERLQSTRIRSEEHTSELQSRENLVCRLLPEKKT